MNALIRKETRLLLPTWAAAVVVALAPAVAGFGMSTSRLPLLLAGGAVLAFVAGLSTFGREFGNGTFSALLALPVSRARVWWTKVGVLAVALGSLYCVWWGSFTVCAQHWPTLWRFASDSGLTPFTSALFVLVVFSGGLWTTLVFRQVAGAIWFALLFPISLLTSVDAIVSRFTGRESVHDAVLVTMVLAYSVGGFLLAWRLFLRAEDAQWTGGVIALPAVSWLARRRSDGDDVGRRRRRPLRALLTKELRLHHGMLLVAVLLLVLHLGTLGLREWMPTFARQPFFEPLLSVFWAFWLVMPVLINASAGAEERKFGLLETQLCQPVGWRRQWLVKFLVATALGVALGTIAPCLLEDPEHLPRMFTSFNSTSPLRPFDPWLSLMTITFGLGLVAFHASSLARNTLQALSFTVVSGVMGTFLFNGLDNPEQGLGVALWRGNLGWVLGFPVAGLALLFLAAGNSRHPVIARRRWIRNGVVLAAVFLGTAAGSTAIYHRCWESFQNVDPAHGPVRIQPANRPALQNDGQLSVRTADGELVVFPRVYRVRSRSLLNHSLVFEEGARHSLGSNFTSHVSFYFETVAVRSDGTLWASEVARPGTIRSWDPIEPPALLARHGLDTNWKTVVRDPNRGRSVLLLRTDGTLWRWGVSNNVGRVSIFHAPAPYRLGAHSDWASIISAGRRIYLTTTNGQGWGINLAVRHYQRAPLPAGEGDSRAGAIDPGLRLESLDDMNLNPSEWQSLSGASTYDLVVKTNGTLWAFGVLPWSRARFEFQLDPGADWIAVAGNFSAGLALKHDGSLWKIDYGSWNRPPRIDRLSRHTDWLAVSSAHDSVYALSADGSLWSWGTYAYRPGWIEIAPSRIPAKVGSLQ